MQAGEFEHHDERGRELVAVVVCHEVTPRHNRHDRKQRADVEHEHTQDDAVDRLRQHLARVLRLGDGHADEFDHRVGEEDHLEAHQHLRPTIRRKREAVNDIRERCLTGRIRLIGAGQRRRAVPVAGDDHDDRRDDEREDQEDLDHHIL